MPQMWKQFIFELLTRKLPKPPRWRHESSIRAGMIRAYYEVLNEQESFQQALESLLGNWSWTRAERFVRWLRLPPRATKDLDWTRKLWERGWLRAPQLQLGGWSYPGLEVGVGEAEARGFGYRPHPPPLKNERLLRLGALRLYRRAVLHWPWQRIADAEHPEQEHHLDIKSVRDDVDRWASALGIALPQRPRGRPPGS
jgi:hypothetical protein